MTALTSCSVVAPADLANLGQVSPRPLPPGPRAAAWQLGPDWRYPRWNFSRHATRLREADAFVVSIQKSGRTWVRFLLTAYYNEWLKTVPEAGGRRAAAARTVPRLNYTHDLWEHCVKPRWSERWRGKWMIPPQAARRRPVLLVARDPRDQMVSLYFHLTRRARSFGGSLGELLRSPVWGVRRVVRIMNRWLAEWVDLPAWYGQAPRLHLLRYEDAHRNPEETFGAAIRFLAGGSGAEVDAEALARATEVACFENMHRLEAGARNAVGRELLAEGGLDREALRPADAADPDSFKVRRGKVGGYLDYLSAADLDYVDRALAALDARYGYGAGAGAEL